LQVTQNKSDKFLFIILWTTVHQSIYIGDGYFLPPEKIMRKEILAALVLSPVMLHAQANSPAKTETPALESRLVQPKSFNALSDTNHAAAAPVRISTGITEPKLVHTAPILSSNSVISVKASERTVVLSLVVDEKGVPTDLKVVKSIDPLTDHNVLDAVSQYRYKPGMLNHQPTAVPVNLEIVIRSSGL
jgi:Gram-negative bacterial TonB protein C-terminal